MGKTVTTYFMDGDPKGSQSVSLSNKICQMFVIPRANISILNEKPELQTPAFYILLGEDENTKPKAYIGETENFNVRVKDHVNKKTFWQKALIFISKDGTTTKADVQYLEYLALSKAKIFCLKIKCTKFEHPTGRNTAFGRQFERRLSAV